MTMQTKTLYTAIGRFERRTNGSGQSCPIIVLGGRDHMVNVREMTVWTILNWRIVKKEEIRTLYEEMLAKSGVPADQSWESCMERLLVRGFVVSGSGETEYDALYDLLSSLYIIPTDGSFFLRLAAFLKLTLVSHVPVSFAKKLFQRDSRTEDERKVMQLARQALLSTAEIIKCMEKGVYTLPDENSILDTLYDDSDTTSDNIGSLAKALSHTKDVTLAVANLYLRQQIIFERI